MNNIIPNKNVASTIDDNLTQDNDVVKVPSYDTNSNLDQVSKFNEKPEFLASEETLKNEPNLENTYINNLELILNTTLENQFISFSGNLYDSSIFLQNVQDSQLILESNRNLNESSYQNYSVKEVDATNVDASHSGIVNLDNNAIFLPISNVTNIESDNCLQDNSAITLVNLQGNLILATDDFFFFSHKT
jgi:hypothetical protein